MLDATKEKDLFVQQLYAGADLAHQMNVEVYLKNPAGIGEHQDIFEAMELEIMEMAKYHDVIEMVETYLE